MLNSLELRILSDTNNEVVSLQHLSSFSLALNGKFNAIQHDDHFQPLIRFFHFLSILMLLNCNKALKTELPIVSFVCLSTVMNTDGHRGKGIRICSNPIIFLICL